MRTKGYRTVGACLMALGFLALAGEILQQSDWMGYAVLLTLGIGFIAGYIQTRRIGFLIPGAVLCAVGIFVFADRTFYLPGEYGGALFLGLLATAFLAVYIAGDRRNPWPLFPAFGLGALASLVLMNTAWDIGRYLLPAVLIAGGLTVLVFPRR